MADLIFAILKSIDSLLIILMMGLSKMKLDCLKSQIKSQKLLRSFAERWNLLVRLQVGVYLLANSYYRGDRADAQRWIGC